MDERARDWHRIDGGIAHHPLRRRDHHCRPLVVAADGAGSPCRTSAGIETETWSYPQAALTARFDHSRPHQAISNEWHRRAGPLTTVPLPGKASSLVWVDTPAETTRLHALRCSEEFARELEHRTSGALGHISKVTARRVFPLSGLTARTLAQNRTALVGESGHKGPPIGAQGLNLTLRDAAWLSDLVADALRDGRDVGASDVLHAYDTARRPDVMSRSVAVDLLNRSLFAGHLAADVGRVLGIGAIAAFPWLRRSAMTMGIGPTGPQPRLLRAA
ncbi:MAG: FAD-dependent monooxygenase [Hyphomicrobiaceae bacterium]